MCPPSSKTCRISSLASALSATTLRPANGWTRTSPSCWLSCRSTAQSLKRWASSYSGLISSSEMALTIPPPSGAGCLSLSMRTKRRTSRSPSISKTRQPLTVSRISWASLLPSRHATSGILRLKLSGTRTRDMRLIPRYPVYVISKGRWESRLTSRALERIETPYRIVVEPQEYEAYAAVIDPAKILVLPFSNLGQGSIPARNWVWDHATDEGHARHWIVDDNISTFFRFNRNLKVPVSSGNIFCAMEDFTDRYENIPIAGPNYKMFASRKTVMPPLFLNTRVYSCILLSNDVPYRWRGRYNEDTDLSLRLLKDGYCTVL